MNRTLMTLSILVAQIAFAQDLPDLRKQAFEGISDCNGSVYSNDSYAYSANAKTLKVLDLGIGKEIAQIQTSGKITAIKSDADQLFILTENELEIWDLAGKKRLAALPTHPDFTAPYSFYAQPRGLALTQDRIYIAHGSHGITVIDRKSEQFEGVIPTQSVARDISISQGTAILVLDNDKQDGFHGFALLDLKRNQIQKYIGVENVFPESVNILGDTLLVGYFSTIWKYRTQDVLTQASPAVLNRVFNFPAGTGSIIGKAHYDQKNMYACYESVDPNGQNPHKHVVVFDRNALGL